MSYFVTGGTGFIGRHLVELLLEREGTIYLLVREGSRGRCEELISGWRAPEERIVQVVGDLGATGLGVSDADRKALKGVDHVFHLAAVYDMRAGEEESFRANVEGTANVVGLANEVGAKRFHHMSSIAVAGAHFRGLFREDMFDEGQKLEHPYYRTKFEAERVVRDQLEVPWRIYRPGIVVGDSNTGEMDKIDGPYYFFKLIQKLRGLFPPWFPLIGVEGGKANIVPVDFVSRAIDHIAHQEGLDGQAFHLVDPKPKSAGEVLNTFAKAAHAPEFAMRVETGALSIVPKPVRAAIGQLPTAQKLKEQVLDDLGIPEEVLGFINYPTDFDTRDTERALEGADIAVPPLEAYAPQLWDYWERHLDPELFKDRSLRAAIDDKVVLVTGASSGIGQAVAMKAAEAGARVLLVARTQEKLEATRAEIEEAGGEAHIHTADLSEADSCEQLIEGVLSEHGRVDILVNNAGRSIRRAVENSYDRFHDYERTIQLNYFGSLKLILGFLPGMRQNKAGHVINISSMGVQTNVPRFSAYVASKAALDAFSRCMASEVVDDNVSVTTVYMPLVKTPMIAPTKIYDAFPTITPDEAADMVTRAMIYRPKKVSTGLGNFAEVAYAVSPKSVDIILNTAYKLFPESSASKGKQLEKGEKPEQEEVSTEGAVFAHLMKGVHW